MKQEGENSSHTECEAVFNTQRNNEAFQLSACMSVKIYAVLHGRVQCVPIKNHIYI